jgi:DNA primase
MAIPQSFIQELLARADVVEIVGRHVPLKKGGANFLGLCPFHSEKSPSFSVSPVKQFYHCFGCGKSGDAIRFLMEHAGMNFVEATNDLAQQYGMQVPEDDTSPQDRERAALQREKQATLTDVLEKAGEAYRKHLKQSTRAVEYFKKRGVSGVVARQFGLGYAPDGWHGLASVFANYDDPLLVESGLVILNEGEDKRYDRFRDRVMFPIRNVKGECIGFGGRVLGEGTPKYLNSPETPVFSKGRELYGLFEARNALREHGYVLVTEGYMDVVALAQLGFPNAVATLGTACTAEHVHKLFRFTDSVVFSFDGDEAGRRAARKALEAALPYATDVRNVKFLFLPAEHDPDSYIREFGQEAFARFVQQAVPLSIFLLEATSQACDLSTAEGRSRMLSAARPLWIQLPDGALKRQLLNEIAQRGSIGAHELTDLWRLGQPADGRWKGGARAKYFHPPAGRRKAIKPKMLALAENIARLALRNSAAWDLLTAQDHELLCSLEGPVGDLFAWLETSFHEHGAQPWAALAAGIEGTSFSSLAAGLMAYDNLQPSGRVVEDTETPEDDLKRTMTRLHLGVIEEEISAANQLPMSDPNRVERLKELSRRQMAVQSQKLGSIS